MRKTAHKKPRPHSATSIGRRSKRQRQPAKRAEAGQKRGSRHDIEHTLNEWALMTGRDDKTLVSAFRKADYFPKPGERIPFKWVEAALFGEEHTEKVRGMRLDNDERERKAKERIGELVNLAEVEKLLTETVIVPLTAVLRDLPATLDTRCNPQEPMLAHRALTDWVEKTCKPLLRERLPKPETNK